MFAVMRLLTFLGGLLWLKFQPPLSDHSTFQIAGLFVIFFCYSTGMYIYIHFNPKNVNKVYKRAIVFDLFFIAFLIHFSGGWESDFYLAYYLLVGLHTFYFNLVTGLEVAGATSVLYLPAIKDDVANVYIGNLIIRFLFLFAVAVPTGLLSMQFRRATQSLKTAYHVTVETLLGCMHNKDPYTGTHSQRVAYFATKIAEELGLSEDETEEIQLAGYLHDLGKIGIPESILQKPDKLTEKEWEVIRKHPELGENIVSPLKLSRDIKRMVRHHHERYDGTGYPDALQGNNILLGARILAMADAYEAMTADRPYRKAFPRGKVLREIHENIGTQFDPAIAKAFLRLLDNHEAELGDSEKHESK